MDSIFVYCEIDEGEVVDVSLELLTKGRSLANELNCKLEAVAIGSNLRRLEKRLYPFGVDVVHLADEERLYPYLTLPHAAILSKLFVKEKPQILSGSLQSHYFSANIHPGGEYDHGTFLRFV